MFALENFKEDTIANIGGISDSDTSLTLTSGNFTNTTDGILVLDYDVAAKREIITCTITGTAITSITRAQGGTSAVAHAQNAKVLLAMTSLHYGGGLGKLASEDAWTAWVPTFTASGSMTYTSVTANKAVYHQVGKLVFFRIDASGTTGGTASNTLFFTLPVAAKDTFGVVGTGLVVDVAAAGAFAYFESATQAGVQKYNVANFSLASGIAHRISGVYEAA